MIGRVIESRPAGALGPMLALGVAAVLFALAATTSYYWAMAAVPPAWFAALQWWGGRRTFRAAFTEQGIDLADPPASIPYASIQGLQAARPPNPYRAGSRRYPIRVVHTGGAVLIPARLNVNSDEVYSFLYQHLSSTGSRDVDGRLLDYLRSGERRFGPERVWTYGRREFTQGGTINHGLLQVCLTFLLTGVVWLAVGLALQDPVWITGLPLTFLGGVASLVLWRTARGRISGAGKKSSLVICPGGLALCQGDLVGELRWDEIRRIKAGPGKLVIHVEGAQVVLNDVYDRPLPVIHQLLEHYHRGGEGPDRPAWRLDATLPADADRDRPGEGGRYSPRRGEYRD